MESEQSVLVDNLLALTHGDALSVDLSDVIMKNDPNSDHQPSGTVISLSEVGETGLSNDLVISDLSHTLTMTNRASLSADTRMFMALFNTLSRTQIRSDPIAVQFAVVFVDNVNKEIVTNVPQSYTLSLPTFGSHPYLDVYKELEDGTVVFVAHAPQLSNDPISYTFNLTDNSVYSVAIPSDPTIYVSPSGTNTTSVGFGSFNTPYRTIPYAITRAQVGDTIFVMEGEYVGSFTINKSVTLNGVKKDMPASALKTISSSSRIIGGIRLSNSNITVNGFDIVGDSGSSYGIESYNTTNNNNITIKSNWVRLSSGIRRTKTSIPINSSTIVHNWVVHDNYVERAVSNNVSLINLAMIDGVDVQNNIVVSERTPSPYSTATPPPALRRAGTCLNSVINGCFKGNSVSLTVEESELETLNENQATFCLLLANEFDEIRDVTISNNEFKDSYAGIVINGNNSSVDIDIKGNTFDNLVRGVQAGARARGESLDEPDGTDNPDVKLINISVIGNTFNSIQHYAHYLGPSSDTEFSSAPFDPDPYVNYRILNNTYNVHPDHAIHVYNGTLYRPWIIFSDSLEAENPDGIIVETKFRYKHTFTRTPGGRLQRNLILMQQGDVPIFQLSRFSFLNNNNVSNVNVRDVILYPVGTPGFFDALISNPNTQVVDLTSIIGIFPTLGMEITLTRKSSTDSQISTETMIGSLQHRLILLNSSTISSNIVRLMAVFAPIYKTHIDGKPIVLQFVVKYIDTVTNTIVDNFPQEFRLEMPTLANRQFLKIYREGADGNSYFITNATPAIENSSSSSFYLFTLDFNSVYSVVDSGALISESGIGSDPHIKTLSGNHWVMNTIRGKNREVQILQDNHLKMVGHIQGYVNGDFLSNVKIIDSKSKVVKCEIDFNKRKIHICDPRFAKIVSEVDSSEMVNSNNSRKGRQTLLVNGFNPGGMYVYIDWNHRYVCPIFNQVVQNKNLKGILV